MTVRRYRNKIAAPLIRQSFNSCVHTYQIRIVHVVSLLKLTLPRMSLFRGMCSFIPFCPYFVAAVATKRAFHYFEVITSCTPKNRKFFPSESVSVALMRYLPARPIMQMRRLAVRRTGLIISGGDPKAKKRDKKFGTVGASVARPTRCKLSRSFRNVAALINRKMLRVRRR